MQNDVIGISNPFAKLLPETVGSIDNDIISSASPKTLHSYYKLGMVNGTMLDVEDHPWYVRKFARYNFDYLKDNQEDGQSIYFEDTKYYSQIKGAAEGKRVINNQYLKIDPKGGKGAQGTRRLCFLAVFVMLWTN